MPHGDCDLPTRLRPKHRVPVISSQGRAMPSINSVSIDKLARLIGTPRCPVLLDVRTDEDFEADPGLIPGSVRRSHGNVSDWSGSYAGRTVIVICQQGSKLSSGVAAFL